MHVTLLLNAVGVGLVYLAWTRGEAIYLIGAMLAFVGALVLSASRYRG